MSAVMSTEGSKPDATGNATACAVANVDGTDGATGLGTGIAKRSENQSGLASATQSETVNTVRNGKDGKFVKGNPGKPPASANRATKEFRDLCRSYTTEALEAIVDVMRSARSARDQLAAATYIINRAFGMPTQPVSGEDGEPLIAPVAILDALKKAAGEPPTGGTGGNAGA
jgi:hypothetical protein